MTGFLLDKKIGVNQPKRIENAKILIANTPMDTDKIKVMVVQYFMICMNPGWVIQSLLYSALNSITVFITDNNVE